MSSISDVTKAFVTDIEPTRIEERAKCAGLSVSAYLRAAGLEQPIRSVFDQTTVVELRRCAKRGPF